MSATKPATGPYTQSPPVMTVHVEDAMDVAIARDTARRAAHLTGFAPAYRARLGSAAAALAEVVLKTNQPQTLLLSGVQHNAARGMQIALLTPWLTSASANNALLALRSKLGDLVDEVLLVGETDLTVKLVLWLTPTREAGDADAGTDGAQ